MWNEFSKILKSYPQLYEDLNCKCTDEDIHKAEEILAIKFPEELRLIYLKNNGQKGDTDGIFKAVSGYNKYTRPKFLSIDSVIAAWHKLSNNQSIAVFQKTYIPFATDNENNMDDVYCVDTETGQVFLLWVLIYDFFNPVEWQTGKFLKAATINEFLHMQSSFYR